MWLKSLETARELSNRVLTSVSTLDAGSLPELLRNQVGPYARDADEYARASGALPGKSPVTVFPAVR